MKFGIKYLKKFVISEKKLSEIATDYFPRSSAQQVQHKQFMYLERITCRNSV
jgi:hypothetical protein